MKSINVYFDDPEFESLENMKGGHSWREFILLMYTHCKEAQKRGDFEIL